MTTQDNFVMNKTLVVAAVLALGAVSTAASAADSSWFVRGEAGRSQPVDVRDDVVVEAPPRV